MEPEIHQDFCGQTSGFLGNKNAGWDTPDAPHKKICFFFYGEIIPHMVYVRLVRYDHLPRWNNKSGRVSDFWMMVPAFLRDEPVAISGLSKLVVHNGNVQPGNK